MIGRPPRHRDLGVFGRGEVQDKTVGEKHIRGLLDLGNERAAARHQATVDISGLQPGDRVILSDMSNWDSTDRVRLN